VTPLIIDVLGEVQVGADPTTAFADLPVPVLGASSLTFFPYVQATRTMVNVTFGPYDGTNTWVISTNTGAASGSVYNVGIAFANGIVRCWPTATIGAGARLRVLGTWRMA
jgi:hypothetical protein